MDIEKLIHCLQCCVRVDAHNIGCDDCGLEYCGPECQQLCGTAATALSTIQAENERLRAELERVKLVRCKDCKMSRPGGLGYAWCGPTAMPLDGFCSNGQQKED